MIDEFTIKECQRSKEVLFLKIKSIEYAIKQSEQIIAEAQMNTESISFLKKKIAQSIQNLEILYLIKAQHDSEKEF